jgi:superfamily II DNA or RNA helicase
MIYRGMVYCDESIRHLLPELRLETQDFNSWKITDQWIETPKGVCVPRDWARRKGFNFEGVCPKVDWPDVTPTYRYNQEQVCHDAVVNLLQTGGCLIEAKTGFGKTFVGCNIARILGTKALVLTHKTDLMKQWKNTAKEFFKVKSGHIQGDKWDYSKPINVATVQTLYARMDDYPKDFLDSFGLIIVDESHRMPCNTFTDVISLFPAKYRLGLSATWRRKDGLEPVWINHISDKFVKGTKNDVPLAYKQIKYSGFSDRDFYLRGEIHHTKALSAIASNKEYNEWCAAGIRHLASQGRNILVTCHQIQQVEKLQEILSDLDIGIYTGKYRGRILKQEDLDLAKTKQVVLATVQKVGEGSDCPKWDTVMLLSPLADPEQVVGRVLRPYPGKEQALVIDVVIDTGYTRALANKRERVYESMKGIKHG